MNYNTVISYFWPKTGILQRNNSSTLWIEYCTDMCNLHALDSSLPSGIRSLKLFIWLKPKTTQNSVIQPCEQIIGNVKTATYLTVLIVDLPLKWFLLDMWKYGIKAGGVSKFVFAILCEVTIRCHVIHR